MDTSEALVEWVGCKAQVPVRQTAVSHAVGTNQAKAGDGGARVNSKNVQQNRKAPSSGCVDAISSSLPVQAESLPAVGHVKASWQCVANRLLPMPERLIL